MAISPQTPILLVLVSFFMLCISRATAVNENLEASFTASHPLPAARPRLLTPPPPLPSTASSQDSHDHFSHTALLAPILSHLGYNELAVAAHSFSRDSSTAWSGPYTLFAPSDSSVRACYSCSVPSVLREHIVPGLFTMNYLSRLAFGTKIETISPGRCITITSSKNNKAVPSVFIGGVAITHPDLFNNGLVVIHGIQGYISPLSPFSCDVQRLSSLSFPIQQDRARQINPQPAIMRLMLRDAIHRLRNNGFAMVSLAMKVKYTELVTLSDMTIFAVDDMSIFSGSHTYLSNFRFHIVPNRYLTMADLEKFKVGTTLPTLDRGQDLVVTTAGGAIAAAPLRINYVMLKVPELIRNLKIVVHAVILPFPHIHPVTGVYDGILTAVGSDGGNHALVDRTMEGTCSSLDEDGRCSASLMSNDKAMGDAEDHHGL